jgi:hypothetical protein
MIWRQPGCNKGGTGSGVGLGLGLGSREASAGVKKGCLTQAQAELPAGRITWVKMQGIRASGLAKVVEHLPSKCKALSSTPVLLKMQGTVFRLRELSV